mmetsp:Transcript_17690/g.40596  ORF Transcript_17690/g.40596 Transcript_17690/m.40596 type:complete len:312 (+) Transcript_17690:431-1366(+)
MMPGTPDGKPGMPPKGATPGGGNAAKPGDGIRQCRRCCSASCAARRSSSVRRRYARANPASQSAIENLPSNSGDQSVSSMARAERAEQQHATRQSAGGSRKAKMANLSSGHKSISSNATPSPDGSITRVRSSSRSGCTIRALNSCTRRGVEVRLVTDVIGPSAGCTRCRTSAGSLAPCTIATSIRCGPIGTAFTSSTALAPSLPCRVWPYPKTYTPAEARHAGGSAGAVEGGWMVVPRREERTNPDWRRSACSATQTASWAPRAPLLFRAPSIDSTSACGTSVAAGFFAAPRRTFCAAASNSGDRGISAGR